MDNEIKYEFKEVNVSAGFTDDGRKKQLEKLKIKMAKDGWEIESYFNGGLSKTSTAKFKRDLNYKEEKKTLGKGSIILILIVLIICIFAFISGNSEESKENYLEKNINKTNAEIKNEQKGTIKKIAIEYAKTNNIEETYYNTMYDCLSDNVYTKSPDFKVQEMLVWCKNDYDNKNTKPYYNKDWLFEDFSSLNGAYKPLENIIKDNMNDPSSYEHIKTAYNFVFYGDSVTRPYMQITTEYRGKNSFGALVKGENTVKIDAKTKEMFDIE